LELEEKEGSEHVKKRKFEISREQLNEILIANFRTFEQIFGTGDSGVEKVDE
jgi:hypothetical protein